MANIIITETQLSRFEIYLREDEKSEATVEKYMRDVRLFADYASGRKVDKTVLLSYKSKLEQSYAAASANSMLAALNAFLRFIGRHELCVKQLRVQRKIYCSEEKELTRAEYTALVKTASGNGNERLCLLIQTVCSSGIRVSELRYITAEAVKKGEATVKCKGKTRTVFIPSDMRKKLSRYMKARGISSGAIFVTKSGNPMNRSNIWREMKRLCRQADVSPDKVFPHNLRHLFARTFYGLEKDISKLADILGHSSINTTRIYIITTGAEHKRKLENMHLIL